MYNTPSLSKKCVRCTTSNSRTGIQNFEVDKPCATQCGHVLQFF